MKNKLLLASFVVLLPCSAYGQSTTWNSADCDASWTLTAGDTIGTQTTVGANWRACRSTTSHNFDGNYVIEFRGSTLTGGNGDYGAMVGFGTSAASLTSFPGAGTTSWGWQSSGILQGGCYYNGSQVGCNYPNSFDGYVLSDLAPTNRAFMKVDSSGNVELSDNTCSYWWTPNWSPISTANPIFVMAGLTIDFGVGATDNSIEILPSVPGCPLLPSGFVAWSGATSTPGGLLLRGIGN